MNSWNQDLLTLLLGLNAMLTGRLPELMDSFDNVSAYLFMKITSKRPKDDKEQTTELLQKIDQGLGRIIGIASAGTGARRQEAESLLQSRPRPQQISSQTDLKELYQSLKYKEQELNQRQQRLNSKKDEVSQLYQYLIDKEQKLNELQERLNAQQRALELQGQDLERQKAKQVQQYPISPARMEAIRQAEQKLRECSQVRQADDSRLLDQLQKLQSKMQDGLQEIMRTREDIEYAAMQEAISQLIQLHELLWEILQYHPGSNRETDYMNLVYSCTDLQENILQALAMLGAEVINGTDVPYNPACHQTKQSVRATRDAVVRSVLKPGFQYKKKVLEKALVELQ